MAQYLAILAQLTSQKYLRLVASFYVQTSIPTVITVAQLLARDVVRLTIFPIALHAVITVHLSVVAVIALLSVRR